jgi:hypothetical protein
VIYPDYNHFLARYPIRVRNESGEVIPPCAVMRPVEWTTSSGRVVCRVGKPDSNTPERYLVNCPIEIAADSDSEGYATYLEDGGLVKYDSGTPAVDEDWGPADGSWGLATDGTGFKIIGEPQTIGEQSVVIAEQVKAATSQASCYYYLKSKTGFAGSGSSANLTAGNLSGFCGASHVIGTESDVGVAYDDAEATPATNGNWDVTKTGTYGIRFWGGVNLSIAGAAIPTWQIKLYHKPSAGSIGEYDDSLGGFPMRHYSSHWFNAAPSGGSTSFTIPVNFFGFAFLESGDTVGIRMQLVDETNVVLSPFASPLGLRATFTYLSTTEMTDTAF